MLGRNNAGRLGLVTLLILAIWLGPWDVAPAAERLRFGTALKTIPHLTLPPLAAQEKGFWEQNGLQVEWVPFDSGAALQRAVAAEQIEMGLTGAVEEIQAIARGISEIIVADLKFRNNYAFWVLRDSPRKEPRDLKGARIAVSRLGGETYALARAVVKALGLEKEAKIVGAGGVTQEVAGLRSGALDAITVSNFTMAPLRVKGEVRALVEISNYLPREWTDNVAFARKELTQKRPEAVRNAIKALLQSTNFILSNRDWSIEKMISHSRYSEEAARLVYPELLYGKDGKISPRTLENMVNFLIQYGLAAQEKIPPLSELYTNNFN